MNPVKRFFENRLYILITITVIMGLILVGAAAKLQIVQGESYKQIAASRTYKSTVVRAPRGEITDRYGRVLAGNKAASTIVVDYDFESKEELNETVKTLLEITEESGKSYEDSFPITLSQPYQFRIDEVNGLNLTEEEWKKKYNINKKATAQQAYDFFAQEFGLSDMEESALKRKIIGVRYDMKLRNFSGANPFSFYTDADISMVSK
ncbi:MAG: hypothetical protein WCX81_05485, partial [Monoglobales bacterium]